jgi:hypothetical protein
MLLTLRFNAQFWGPGFNAQAGVAYTCASVG